MKESIDNLKIIIKNSSTLKLTIGYLLLGALLTLAFSPFNFIIAIPLSFCLVLFLFEEADSLDKTLWYGFCYGFAYFLSSLYWVSNSLFIENNKFILMLPLAAIVLPSILSSMYVIPVFLLTYCFESKLVRALVFGHMWCICEVIRAHFVIPLPWNMLGYVLASDDMLLQNASYLGLYGATYLVSVLSPLFYSGSRTIIILIFMEVISMYCFGFIRLDKAIVQFHNGLDLKIVQPNLHHHFGDIFKQKHNFETLRKNSIGFTSMNTAIVFWPEASYPYLVQGEYFSPPLIGGIIPKDGFLILGADRRMTSQYFNSVFVVNSKLNVEGVYDKEILVPFGEYVPLRFLPFISKIAYGFGVADFTEGKNANHTIEIDGIPSFMPLVCYEIIFPDLLRGANKPEFFLSMVNEIWFGDTIGPYQHFAMAKFRAAEYGVPIVRASNTGFSSVIDPYGRVISFRPIGTSDVIIGRLPNKL